MMPHSRILYGSRLSIGEPGEVGKAGPNSEGDDHVAFRGQQRGPSSES